MSILQNHGDLLSRTQIALIVPGINLFDSWLALDWFSIGGLDLFGIHLYLSCPAHQFLVIIPTCMTRYSFLYAVGGAIEMLNVHVQSRQSDPICRWGRG